MRSTVATPSIRALTMLSRPVVLLLAGCAAAAGPPTTTAVATHDATPRPVRVDFSFPCDGVAGVSWCDQGEQYQHCGDSASDGSEDTLATLVRAPLLGDTGAEAPMHRSGAEAWVLDEHGIARSDYGVPQRFSNEQERSFTTREAHLDPLPDGGEALRLVTTTCTPEALEPDVGVDVDADSVDAAASGCHGCQYTAMARYVYAADGRLIGRQEFTETCECVDSRFNDTTFQYVGSTLSGIRYVEYVHPTCREFGDGWDTRTMRYASGTLPEEDHWLECELSRDRLARPLELRCRSEVSGTDAWGRVAFHYAE